MQQQTENQVRSVTEKEKKQGSPPRSPENKQVLSQSTRDFLKAQMLEVKGINDTIIEKQNLTKDKLNQMIQSSLEDLSAKMRQQPQGGEDEASSSQVKEDISHDDGMVQPTQER